MDLNGLCRKMAFSRQNPKIVYWKINNLRVHTFLFSVICDRAVLHRGWAYFQARLAFTMAAFNVLVQWHGFHPNASGFVPLSMAEFSL